MSPMDNNSITDLLKGLNFISQGAGHFSSGIKNMYEKLSPEEKEVFDKESGGIDSVMNQFNSASQDLSKASDQLKDAIK